jgi:beta-galactosidase
VRLQGAQPLASYTDDFYADEPAMTVNRSGKGRAYYLATRPEDEALRAILAAICEETGIGSPLDAGAPPPAGVEVTERLSPTGTLIVYVLNHNTTETEVNLADGQYTDLLTDETFTGSVLMPPRGIRVLKLSTA